ncbi:MAG: acyl-CoA thioesterase [Desulfuromonadaceae bacterium]
MNSYASRLEFQVRDYECDMQGVVNNAVYQNYLEHARHEYIKTLGIDFAELARQKINLVVIRVELDYRTPLASSDRFWIGTRMEKVSPLRFAFHQDIFHQEDNRLILKARVIGTALNEKGRPKMPEAIARALSSAAE